MSQEEMTKLGIVLVLFFIVIWRIGRGYRIGFVKELYSLLSLAVGLVSIVLFLILYQSLKAETWGSTITIILALVVFILGLKIGKLILLPLKGLAALPFLKFIDKLFGAAAGLIEGVAIVYVSQYLLIALNQPVLFTVPTIML